MRKFSGYGPSLIVLATAVLVLFAGPRAVQQLTYEQTKTRIIQAKHSLESTDILQKLNQAYGDVATIVEPSVVHVSAQYVEADAFGNERAGLSTGSGWIWDSNGHIVTNHHVIQSAERIDVQLYNGEVRDAQIIGSDPSTDIAVIKISPSRLHPATLAEPEASVNQGDLVFAFGSPFDFRFSMSSGVVSGKDRSVGVIRDDSGRRLGYENFIQVDAAINPGNSGGPLTDFRGRVIGMNTAIATGRRGALEEGQFAGIGLAIPLDMIQPAVTQIIKNGFVEKGYLGVNVPPSNDFNATMLRRLGFNGQGVVITGVREHEAAEQAGVRANDVVTKINGRDIASIAQLQSLVSSVLPGETVKLSVWRIDPADGSEKTIEIPVELKRLDMLMAAGEIPPDAPHDSLHAVGIARMATNTAELSAIVGAAFHPGVILQELVADSPLAQRISNGTTIVAVKDRPVRNVDDFIHVLRDYDLRSGVSVEAYEPDGRRAIFNLRVQ